MEDFKHMKPLTLNYRPDPKWAMFDAYMKTVAP